MSANILQSFRGKKTEIYMIITVAFTWRYWFHGNYWVYYHLISNWYNQSGIEKETINPFYFKLNFQLFKLVLEKAEEPEIKLPTSAGLLKKQESSRKTSISASLTMLKPLIVWITTVKMCFKEMEVPDHLTCLLRNLYVGSWSKEPDMEQQTDSKVGKEYSKSVCCTLLI